MLYIGAEFCPICATQRWPMTVALSHFGTFSNLQQTHSAVSDGNIPTLSYYGSTFTSPYLTFTPVETTTNQPSGNYYQTLETPTAAQNALWQANSPDGQADLPLHRHRREMVAADVAVPGHRRSKESPSTRSSPR